MEEENKEKKKSKKLLLIILFLIIILFGYLLYQHFWNGEEVSTGNLQEENTVENEMNNNIIENIINNTITGENTTVSNPENVEETPEETPEEEPIVEEFVIESEDFKWGEKTNIKVFENIKLNAASNVIWPGAEGEYHFLVSNTLKNDAIYKISFEETNTSDINIYYKIIKDGEEIVSNWSKIVDIDIAQTTLSSNEKHNYILQWKWIEQTDEEDMEKMGKPYELNINIYTESR